ncbi:Rubrerythrin [Mariprofundus ferrinatatus]|uniref:Rubrerythrin n=1 Tax=Mariprofundus ferrinatatus TaxID=1921087 RepID=A0A2K8L9W7_9PROT|nr:ferritin family protein [Mariprofundus ferrinatatus]ATX81066.1 Rubrerythrin [Mariprofundus ferrinatatus]
MHRPAAWTMFTAALLLALSGNIQHSQAEDAASKPYPETLAVMQMLYGIETRAEYRFNLFSERAKEDGYGRTAHLFKAISLSESIHAAHFKALIEELGGTVAMVDFSSIKAESTKENLEYAATTELAEINNQYPRYIDRINPENHQQAMEYVRFAWEAEKHHRALIVKVHSGADLFFDKLLSSMDATSSRYYVNRNCGTTVSKLPPDACPVCHLPINSYVEVARP